MLEEITVTAEEHPSLLAEVGELLGRAGVNIATLSATTFHERAVVHLVVDDGEDAAEILASHGFKLEGTRPVLAVTLDDRPGELGRYCRNLADNGVTVSAAYLARRNGGETELIFAVDNLEVARQSAG